MPDDPESAGGAWYCDRKNRKNFAGKVFLLTGFMLFIASVIIILPLASDEIQEALVLYSIPIITVTMIFACVSVCALFCCYQARHCFPINLILLIILSVAYGLLAAMVSSNYSSYVVILSFGTTVVIVILVGALAKWGPFDITGCGLLMCGLSMALMLSIIVSAIVGIFFQIPLIHLIISCLVVIAYTFFLLCDMQLILGGKREELDRDEYILGAVILFMDIIVIFLYILEIVAAIAADRK